MKAKWTGSWRCTLANSCSWRQTKEVSRLVASPCRMLGVGGGAPIVALSQSEGKEEAHRGSSHHEEPLHSRHLDLSVRGNVGGTLLPLSLCKEWLFSLRREVRCRFSAAAGDGPEHGRQETARHANEHVLRGGGEKGQANKMVSAVASTACTAESETGSARQLTRHMKNGFSNECVDPSMPFALIPYILQYTVRIRECMSCPSVHCVGSGLESQHGRSWDAQLVQESLDRPHEQHAKHGESIAEGQAACHYLATSVTSRESVRLNSAGGGGFFPVPCPGPCLFRGLVRPPPPSPAARRSVVAASPSWPPPLPRRSAV